MATVPNVFEQADVARHAAASRLPNVRVPLETMGTDGVRPDQVAALERGNGVVLPAYHEAVEQARGASVIPDKTIREAISAHGVGFGWLKDRSDAHPVALKPFSRADKALSEINGLLILQRIGVETYSPLGAFPAADGEHFVVVTAQRDDLVSLDRDEWVVGRRVASHRDIEIAENNNQTVKAVASLLGSIHARGIFHPDGQIKNFAKTPEGKVGIIDAESLFQIDLSDDTGPEHAWHDVEKLVRSLIGVEGNGGDASIFGVGMLHGMSLADARAAIEELIIEPYMEALTQANQDASGTAVAHIARLYEGMGERFYGQTDWPSHVIGAGRR